MPEVEKKSAHDIRPRTPSLGPRSSPVPRPRQDCTLRQPRVVSSIQLRRQLIDNFVFALGPNVDARQLLAHTAGSLHRHDSVSCVSHASDLVERLEELAPQLATLAQHGAAGRRQAIEAPSPLARSFDPPAFRPAALFELVEKWIQGRRLKLETALGPLFDQLGNLVPVTLRAVQTGEDEKLGAALLEGPGGHVGWCHIGGQHTYQTATGQVRVVPPQQQNL